MFKSRDPATAARTRVFLVAGNPNFLGAATAFLQRYDELEVAANLREDEAVLARGQAFQPQVILLDLDGPEQAGLETGRSMRALLPHVPIVALALSDSAGYRQAALAGGASDFVLKARVNTDLLPAIRRAVGSGREGPDPAGADDPEEAVEL